MGGRPGACTTRMIPNLLAGAGSSGPSQRASGLRGPGPGPLGDSEAGLHSRLSCSATKTRAPGRLGPRRPRTPRHAPAHLLRSLFETGDGRLSRRPSPLLRSRPITAAVAPPPLRFRVNLTVAAAAATRPRCRPAGRQRARVRPRSLRARTGKPARATQTETGGWPGRSRAQSRHRATPGP